MIKQLFKIMWNRKSANILLITEVFFSCLVVFIISGLLTQRLKNYSAPLGFKYKNLICLNVFWQESSEAEKNQKAILRERYKTIYKELEAFKDVEMVSWCSYNYPYSSNTCQGEVKYKSIRAYTNIFSMDDNFLKITELNLVKGRWFNKNDDTPGFKPVVICRELEQSLFGKGSSLGKIIGPDGEEFRVIGVVSGYKYQGEYSQEESSLFHRNTISDTSAGMDGYYIIKLKPGSSIMTEDKIIKRITGMYPGANISLASLEDLRKGMLKPVTMDIVIFIFLGGFLIINVALGLFGILWHNINKRKSEIGIRRALGASRKMIYMQIFGEVIVLSTISIALGIFFETQIVITDLLNFKTAIYIAAILISALFIYFVTALCAAYPAHLASRIQAAEALHDE